MFKDKKILEMTKSTKCVFNGRSVIVPLADVQYIEKLWCGYSIITKHNNIIIDTEEGVDLIEAWLRYRAELDGEYVIVKDGDIYKILEKLRTAICDLWRCIDYNKNFSETYEAREATIKAVEMIDVILNKAEEISIPHRQAK